MGIAVVDDVDTFDIIARTGDVFAAMMAFFSRGILLSLMEFS